MANTRTTALEALAISYDRDSYIAPHERRIAKFYSRVQAWPGKPAFGKQMTWAIKTANSHAAAIIAEGGDYPTDPGQSWIQATVSPKEIAVSATITELLAVIAQGDGFLSGPGDMAAMIVKDAIKDGLIALNRATLGLPSGVIGTVATTTDTSTTVPLTFPNGGFRFRKNFPVQFYDAATGGTIQGAEQTVDFVYQPGPSPYLIIDAPRTLTAGWSIVRSGEYDASLEGLEAIVDDGDLTSTLFTLTRSADPDVNALVFDPGSGLTLWSENALDQMFLAVAMEADYEIDALWCNEGIPVAQRQALSGSRILMGPGGDGVPAYELGHDTGKMYYNFNGRRVPFEVDRDLPARTVFGVTMGLFRKYSPKELDWTGDGVSPAGGASAPVWLQLGGSTAGTYRSSKGAFANAFTCIGHLMPKLNFRGNGFVDTALCADTP